MTNSSQEVLIHEYCREYMEKVFYFCLKKTGYPSDAEELCSNISLGVITSLRNGTMPENFAAWVWRTARNHYADYCESKRISAGRFGGDLENLEVDDGSEHPIDSVIRAEELNLLRRELAFITEEYRNIIVAFYIDDLPIRKISLSLGLPEGTVKSKLHRARKKLKEGMNMAREFGPKSYKPEEVYFSASGHVYDNKSNMPWGGVKRKIQKNILLEASNNPSTIEELSTALGIAMPYMEEEVNLLNEGTLLKKIDDKYITNFPILSAGVQRRIFEIEQNSVDERANILNSVAEASIEDVKALGCIRNGKITDDQLKWWIICSISHISDINASDYSIEPRENGERWGLVGYEKTDLRLRAPFVSNINGGDINNSMFRSFVIHSAGVATDKTMQESPYVVGSDGLLADIIRNNRKLDSFTESERQVWSKIDGLYAHANPDGSIVPDVLVFEGGRMICDCPSLVYDVYRKHSDFNKLISLDEKVNKEVVGLLKSENSDVLATQLRFVASMSIRLDALSINRIIEKGYLAPLDNPGRTTVTSDIWIA